MTEQRELGANWAEFLGAMQFLGDKTYVEMAEALNLRDASRYLVWMAGGGVPQEYFQTQAGKIFDLSRDEVIRLRKSSMAPRQKRQESLIALMVETFRSGYVLTPSELPPVMLEHGYSASYGPGFMFTRALRHAVTVEGGDFYPRTVDGQTVYYDASIPREDTDMDFVLGLVSKREFEQRSLQPHTPQDLV